MPGVITALSRSTIDAPVELAWSVLGDYANDVCSGGTGFVAWSSARTVRWSRAPS